MDKPKEYAFVKLSKNDYKSVINSALAIGAGTGVMLYGVGKALTDVMHGTNGIKEITFATWGMLATGAAVLLIGMTISPDVPAADFIAEGTSGFTGTSVQRKKCPDGYYSTTNAKGKISCEKQPTLA